MILLSARRVELEVRLDDDKRRLLPLTRNNRGLPRHLLIRLLVETSPKFPEGLV